MTKKVFAILAGVALLVALAPAIGLADGISGTTGSWQSTWTANNNGNPYWDNTGSVSGEPNIGFCLLTPAGCGISSAPGHLDYWGTSTGAADPDITFSSTGTSTGALKIELAGNAGSNIFGYTDSTGSYVIFNGSAVAGATATFTPVGTYSFFLDDTAVGVGDTWYTDSSLNSQGTGQQHFAVFNGGAGTYWLGMEDLPLSTGDKDYNDMVVQITSNPVPEPGTLTLLGTGLIGLARMIRRRRAA